MRRRGLIGVTEQDKRLYIFDGNIKGTWGYVKLSTSSYYRFQNIVPYKSGDNMYYGFPSGIFYQGSFCNIPINFDDYSKVVITFENITYPKNQYCSFYIGAKSEWATGVTMTGKGLNIISNNSIIDRIPKDTTFPHTEIFELNPNVGLGYIGFSSYQESAGGVGILISEMYLE